MQEYNQDDLLSISQAVIGKNLYKIAFQYIPGKEEKGAALNFHLTKREKQDIAEALGSEANKKAFERFRKMIK